MYGRYTTDTDLKMFADAITSIVCELIITWTNRTSSTRQSILDHIYEDNSILNGIVLSAVITRCLSDHYFTLVQ